MDVFFGAVRLVEMLDVWAAVVSATAYPSRF
jgi:hypothetical protein